MCRLNRVAGQWEQVAIGNQDLKTAEAQFREARAMIRFSRGSEFPTISTTPSISSVRASASRPYLSGTAGAGSRADFVLPFDLSYELDMWGRVRRSVSAAREEAQATAADLASSTLALPAPGPAAVCGP